MFQRVESRLVPPSLEVCSEWCSALRTRQGVCFYKSCGALCHATENTFMKDFMDPSQISLLSDPAFGRVLGC